MSSESIGMRWRTCANAATGAPPTRWVGDSGTTREGCSFLRVCAARSVKRSYWHPDAPDRRGRDSDGCAGRSQPAAWQRAAARWRKLPSSGPPQSPVTMLEVDQSSRRLRMRCHVSVLPCSSLGWPPDGQQAPRHDREHEIEGRWRIERSRHDTEQGNTGERLLFHARRGRRIPAPSCWRRTAAICRPRARGVKDRIRAETQSFSFECGQQLRADSSRRL